MLTQGVYSAMHLKEHSTILKIGSFSNSPRVKQLSFTVFCLLLARNLLLVFGIVTLLYTDIYEKVTLLLNTWRVTLNN